MTGPCAKPLRGEAAWRASIKEIAKRNEAAQAEGGQRRAAKDAAAAREVAMLERREARDLPQQPCR